MNFKKLTVFDVMKTIFFRWENEVFSSVCEDLTNLFYSLKDFLAWFSIRIATIAIVICFFPALWVFSHIEYRVRVSHLRAHYRFHLDDSMMKNSRYYAYLSLRNHIKDNSEYYGLF